MIMSMNEYIRNPAGKSNAVYSARYMYQDMYSSKYAKVMAKEAGKMQYRLFKGENERWIIHLKVPSEAISDFYYDVVLEFTPNDNSFSNDLFTYKMRAFSNDPRFVFVFAHSFIKNKMFFEDLVKKMSPQAVRMKPTLTNPKEEIGYVKSIYFAYLYMKDHSLNNKNQWFAAETYHANDLLQNVMDTDDKIYLRQKAKPISNNIYKRPGSISTNKSKKLSSSDKIGLRQMGASGNVTRRKGAGSITRVANTIRRAKATGKGQYTGNVVKAKVARTTKRK